MPFVSLSFQDATIMQAYTSQPAGNGPFPAIIVFQEAFGVNHHIRDVADRFAKQGYIAIAPELFHRTAPAGFEAPYGDFSQVAPHYQAITDQTIEADALATWTWLQQNTLVQKDKIACIGYCLGGRVSFMANSILPFKAAITYYGGGTAQQLKRVPSLHAPMLFCWGGLDKHITHDQVNAITAEMVKEGKPHVNVVFSFADHGFFCDARPSYQPQAAKEAWALTLAFLEQNLN